MKSAIILSDMFGYSHKTHHYMEATAEILEEMNYQVEAYSSTILAHINHSDTAATIHQLFLDGGIKNAATTLSKSTQRYDLGIGFSVGGLILWEACKINPLFVKDLVCISSTRLRYQTIKLTPTNTTLIYGENDSHAPDLAIITALSDHYSIIQNHGHELYKNRAVLEALLADLKID